LHASAFQQLLVCLDLHTKFLNFSLYIFSIAYLLQVSELVAQNQELEKTAHTSFLLHSKAQHHIISLSAHVSRLQQGGLPGDSLACVAEQALLEQAMAD